MRAMFNALHARLNSCCCKGSCFQQALGLVLCGLCTNGPRLCGGESPTCCLQIPRTSAICQRLPALHQVLQAATEKMLLRRHTDYKDCSTQPQI